MTKWPTDSRGLIDPVAACEQYSKEAREHYARLADKPQMSVSDNPCATLMIGGVEFVSQGDGSVLMVADPTARYSRVEEHQVMQLFVWLSNHLRIKL